MFYTSCCFCDMFHTQVNVLNCRSMCILRLASVLRLFVIYLARKSISIAFASSDKIHWELLTKPAVFGNAIMLDCRLPVNACCNRYTRRWLGGHGLGLLVMDGVSASPKKYSEVFNAETRSSKLTIHALNPNDVNIPYECTYGFKTYTKDLTLSKDMFESYPSEPFDVNVTMERGNILSVNIKLQPVYPEPNCSATFDGTDISNFVNITAVMKGLFYVVVIISQYTMVSPDCAGLFFLVCKIGTKLLEVQRNVTCSDDSSNTGCTELRSGLGMSDVRSPWFFSYDTGLALMVNAYSGKEHLNVMQLQSMFCTKQINEKLISTLKITLILAGVAVFAICIVAILYRINKSDSHRNVKDQELNILNPISSSVQQKHHRRSYY